MILQRDAEIKLWGTADESVTITFLDRQYHTDPDASGYWEVMLSDLQPGGPYTLTINEITINDVFIGDVWLCSGQSNMQIPMQRVKHMYPEELKNPNPYIRQFSVPLQLNFNKPMDALNGGGWVAASPEAIKGFSAVAYFFAKRLYERYQVPVGLIVSANGGTPIHAWMSRGSLEDFPELLCEADLYTDEAYAAKIQNQETVNMESFLSGIDNNDPGLAEMWYSPDYDDKAWEERPLLEPWEGTGSVWLRKTIEIPPELSGKPATLFLGTVIDWDRVYVNGEAVGNTTYRYPPREYVIPSLPQGICVIAIRVISKEGGGFTPGKQYLLTTDAGSICLCDNWKFLRGARTTPPPAENYLHNKPLGIYNGMIAPLKRFAIKGVLWYQGESDDVNPKRYAEKFAAMVRGWRTEWGYDFPFLFVELPHWAGGSNWSPIRQQQWQSLEVPKTAMAAAFDLGEHNDLHSQGKQAVGDRLARCAMRVAYGEKMSHSPFEIVGYRSTL